MHTNSSTTEAELAALYIMARETVYFRIILQEMGNKQPPTPIQTNNLMTDTVVNGKITPKRTKAMDILFHWLRNRECQQQFKIFWWQGKTNYGWWRKRLIRHGPWLMGGMAEGLIFWKRRRKQKRTQ